MYGTLVVNSWVGIHEGCDITYSVDALAAKEEAEWDAREQAAERFA